MNFCILGIGNIGDKYINTRHNTGFILLDQCAKNHHCEFVLEKYTHVANFSLRSHNFYLLKPTTFVNLSGVALDYWMKKLNVKIENVLVIVDDINLDLGHIRFRNSGGSGGHNGLKNISLNLNSDDYKRLRIGVGHDFVDGQQADFVMKPFSNDELEKINSLVPVVEKILEALVEQNENVRTKIINDAIAKFYN